MNHVLGVHLAATTPKPQTTRNRILGIHTQDDYQLVFVDTPGIHADAKKLLNRKLNKTAIATLAEADVIVFLVEAGSWTEEDRRVLEYLQAVDVPVILVANKVDRIGNKESLLPYLQAMSLRHAFAELVPISAFRAQDIDYLLEKIKAHVPRRAFEFEEDEMTDRSMRFVSSELIREQLMQALEKEVPYSVAVQIEQYEEGPKGITIGAVIYVEREGQKRIVIGKKGETLKKVGMEARKRIAGIVGCPVHTKLWVKVKEGWTENARLLEQFSLDRDL
jgi:GTP-binding protein Era